MSTWGLAWRIVDTLLEGAIRLDRYLDERKARKKRGLSFKDVQHQQTQIARATRSRAPTVILPRPTSPPAAGAARAPTAPSKASPHRR